jgi:hypothetical protein
MFGFNMDGKEGENISPVEASVRKKLRVNLDPDCRSDGSVFPEGMSVGCLYIKEGETPSCPSPMA